MSASRGSRPRRRRSSARMVNPLVEHVAVHDRARPIPGQPRPTPRPSSARPTASTRRRRSILFSNVPAALLLYAGDPILQGMRGTQFQRAVNTPMMVVRDTTTNTFYLNGGPLWYSAPSGAGAMDQHQDAAAAPVKALVPDSLQRDSAPPGAPPRIIVATTPTELIVVPGRTEVDAGERHRSALREQHRPQRAQGPRRPADVRAALRPLVPRGVVQRSVDVRAPRFPARANSRRSRRHRRKADVLASVPGTRAGEATR